MNESCEELSRISLFRTLTDDDIHKVCLQSDPTVRPVCLSVMRTVVRRQTQKVSGVSALITTFVCELAF